ncbi:MAG: methylenetetrahydrofolate reductase [Clostridia bacterium]|nr:methylenetetrahydrofolate reductase [Clostridia bacterium]
MQDKHIHGSYHVEIIPPKQDSQKLEEDLVLFSEKLKRVQTSGFTASITDNAMGRLAFQGCECIEELGLTVDPEKIMIHLNAFHTKEGLDEILSACTRLGIRTILAVSGDGSPRLPRLKPEELGITNAGAVTSVELIRYIRSNYPELNVGCAFNPYEPETEEFEKMERKLAAGARFVVTQPIIEKNPLVDKLIEKHPDLPLSIEIWMSPKLYLLSDVVGYPIPTDASYDPIATLETLRAEYSGCGVYLSLLGFKTQYDAVEALFSNRTDS